MTVCRFAVNLRYQQLGGDIAFHFCPRVNEGVVVRNSLLGGSWGQEERNQPSFPFQAGQQFTMIILCEPTEFKVSRPTGYIEVTKTKVFHTALNSWYMLLNSAWAFAEYEMKYNSNDQVLFVTFYFLVCAWTTSRRCFVIFTGFQSARESSTDWLWRFISAYAD